MGGYGAFTVPFVRTDENISDMLAPLPTTPCVSCLLCFAVVYVLRTMDAQTVTRPPHPEGAQSGGCGIGGGMGRLMVSLPVHTTFVSPGLGMVTRVCIFGSSHLATVEG